MLAGWRSASEGSGGRCVMTPGIAMMLVLCADSWDTLTQVESLSIVSIEWW